MSVPTWPAPNAPRSAVDAFVRENAPPPEPTHEAPPIANGPSLVCNACGKVRINVFNGPFCKGCSAQIEAATGNVVRRP